MLVHEAESRFRKGLEELARGRARDAMPYISAAMEVQNETGEIGFGQATYLSYHGLCLCLTRTGRHEGLAHCRRASEMDPCNPDIWWNLGRVALIVERRWEAYRAFQRGLGIEPGHAGIVRDLKRMGIRRAPALPFLSRSNPINRLLGRLRRVQKAEPRRRVRSTVSRAATS